MTPTPNEQAAPAEVTEAEQFQKDQEAQSAEIAAEHAAEQGDAKEPEPDNGVGEDDEAAEESEGLEVEGDDDDEEDGVEAEGEDD